MHYCLFIGEGTVSQFDMRLNRINDYLVFFPYIQRHNGNYKQCKALYIINMCFQLKVRVCWVGTVVALFVLNFHKIRAVLLRFRSGITIIVGMTSRPSRSHTNGWLPSIVRAASWRTSNRLTRAFIDVRIALRQGGCGVLVWLVECLQMFAIFWKYWPQVWPGCPKRGQGSFSWVEFKRYELPWPLLLELY